jgi:DNA-binding NtrC family response regulator
MKTVLVVGRDWKFRALLRAQLQEEGFDALGFETLEAAAGEIAGPTPDAVVFDTTDAPAAELAQLPTVSRELYLLVVASAGESLPLPEERVRRRPLQVSQLISVLKNRLG